MAKFNIDGIEFEKEDGFDIVRFDDKKAVATAMIPKLLTASDIDNIICTAFEGGIGYWAGVKRPPVLWANKPSDLAISDWATLLLLNNKSVEFYDREDDTTGDEWTLTLDKLVKGYVQNCKERSWDCDLEQGDAATADCIIQYALFGKIVYG